MVNYSQAELPASFGQMRSLIQLSVYTGQLQRLPNATGLHHPNLVDLVVVANRLVELPEDIGGLGNLLNLNVNKNQLRSLPDSVGKLKNLLKSELLVRTPTNLNVCLTFKLTVGAASRTSKSTSPNDCGPSSDCTSCQELLEMIRKQ